MREVLFSPEFSAWRSEARTLLQAAVPPHEILWKTIDEAQTELPGLFAQSEMKSADFLTVHPTFRVPAEFVEIAQSVAVHRSSEKWSLLYRVLWRLAKENSLHLQDSLDPDIVKLKTFEHSVRHDLHKMKAFVRFREVKDEHGPQFIAWHRPDHLIVRLAGPFFARRFQGMRWMILTEDLSVRWNGEELQYLPGCGRREAPTEDVLEDLWKTYYASTFNPARIKLRMMRKEMAVRYWDTMPETAIIRDLLRDSSSRIDEFYMNEQPSAKKWFPKIPENEWTLPLLREAAKDCRACGICEKATQTVFGEGSPAAEIAFVGEQPGDQEDLAGRPFIGPSGEMLNQALIDAGIDRSIAYVTNAVKHFKWTPSGKIRLHQKPLSSEVSACQAWLRAELAVIQPRVLICLGATAAQSIMGRSVKLDDVRGKFFATAYCSRTLVTTHPAAILRTTDYVERQRLYQKFVAELSLLHLPE